MKPLNKGLLLGSAVTLLAVLTISATTMPSIIRVIVAKSVKVDGIFNPHAVVWIDESAPYTVPQGKLLVITGGGEASWDFTGDGVSPFSAPMKILVNGVEIYEVPGVGALNTPGQVRDLPITGLVAPEGAVVSLQTLADFPPFQTGRAVGYLVDA